MHDRGYVHCNSNFKKRESDDCIDESVKFDDSRHIFQIEKRNQMIGKNMVEKHQTKSDDGKYCEHYRKSQRQVDQNEMQKNKISDWNNTFNIKEEEAKKLLFHQSECLENKFNKKQKRFQFQMERRQNTSIRGFGEQQETRRKQTDRRLVARRNTYQNSNNANNLLSCMNYYWNTRKKKNEQQYDNYKILQIDFGGRPSSKLKQNNEKAEEVENNQVFDGKQKMNDELLAHKNYYINNLSLQSIQIPNSVFYNTIQNINLNQHLPFTTKKIKNRCKTTEPTVQFNLPKYNKSQKSQQIKNKLMIQINKITKPSAYHRWQTTPVNKQQNLQIINQPTSQQTIQSSNSAFGYHSFYLHKKRQKYQKKQNKSKQIKHETSQLNSQQNTFLNTSLPLKIISPKKNLTTIFKKMNIKKRGDYQRLHINSESAQRIQHIANILNHIHKKSNSLRSELKYDEKNKEKRQVYKKLVMKKNQNERVLQPKNSERNRQIQQLLKTKKVNIDRKSNGQGQKNTFKVVSPIFIKCQKMTSSRSNQLK